MPITILTETEDGPEEGEIVSDDFEDISDDSMTFTNIVGKSTNSRGQLDTLSLSNVSETEELHIKKKHRRSRSKRAKKRKSRKKPVVESSDDEPVISNSFKSKLKTAVHIFSPVQNNLFDRIKAMTNINNIHTNHEETGNQPVKSSTSEDSVVLVEKSPDVINLIDEPDVFIKCSPLEVSDTVNCFEITDAPKEKNDIDEELIKLRIEVLKTALDKKYSKKKTKIGDDTNKENSSNNYSETPNETQIKPTATPLADQRVGLPDPPSTDEDEINLRARLLKSLPRKVGLKKRKEFPMLPSSRTVNVTKPSVISVKQNRFRVNNMKHAKAQKPVEVQPLIIQLGTDSDSDMDISDSCGEKEVQIIDNTSIAEQTNPIELQIDNFLKEERAKVESLTGQVTKAISNKTTKTANKESSLELSRKTPTQKKDSSHKLKISSQNQAPVLKSPEEEKSAIKYLPPNKKEEYKKLCSLLKTKELLKKQKAKSLKPIVKQSQTETDLETNDLRNASVETKSNKQVVSQEGKCTQVSNTSVKVSVQRKEITDISNKEANSSGHKTGSVNVQDKMQQTDSKKDSLNSFEQPNITTNSRVPSVLRRDPKKGHSVLVSLDADSYIEELIQQEKASIVRKKEQQIENSILRRTVMGLQTKLDDRLQMREKYRPLFLSIKELNQLSKRQKQLDQEVKIVLEELKTKRTEQGEIHLKMSRLIRDLAQRKASIDSEISAESNTTDLSQELLTETSTLAQDKSSSTSSMETATSYQKVISPLKKTISSVVDPVENTTAKTVMLKRQNLMTSTPIRPPKVPRLKDFKNTPIVSVRYVVGESADIQNRFDQTTIGADRSLYEGDRDIKDPNDMDKVIQKTTEKVTMLQKKDVDGRCKNVLYISPLSHHHRTDSLDPFGIMCPFEVNGTCKDPECSYNHLPK